MWGGFLSYELALMEAGVPTSNLEDCMRWAFGEDWGILRIQQIDEVWNSRHDDLFQIPGTELIITAFEKIGKAYIKEVLSGT